VAVQYRCLRTFSPQRVGAVLDQIGHIGFLKRGCGLCPRRTARSIVLRCTLDVRRGSKAGLPSVVLVCLQYGRCTSKKRTIAGGRSAEARSVRSDLIKRAGKRGCRLGLFHVAISALFAAPCPFRLRALSRSCECGKRARAPPLMKCPTMLVPGPRIRFRVFLRERGSHLSDSRWGSVACDSSARVFARSFADG
jgi:hypothetical protein